MRVRPGCIRPNCTNGGASQPQSLSAWPGRTIALVWACTNDRVTREPVAEAKPTEERIRISRPAMLVMAIAIVLAATAHGETATITCSGTLVDVELKPRAWPLAVIDDEAGGYACTIDRAGAGHDPMRPCSAGTKCRIVGTYRKIGQTYPIQTVISIEGS
jgi:hypothetical protein